MADSGFHSMYYRHAFDLYGVPNVPKTLRNAVFVYPPLIYKYDTDLAKYLPDLYKSGSDYKCQSNIYIRARYINWGQIYKSDMDLYIWL